MRMADTIETGGRRRGLALLCGGLGLAALLPAGSPSHAGSPPDTPAAVPGELIVRFEPSARPALRASALAHTARATEPLGLPGAKLVTLRGGASRDAAIAALKANPAVAYAEPNYLRAIRTAPDDPYLSHQWGLRQIGAGGAWRRGKGSRSVAIAVADDGVEITHPDLEANIWANPGEGGELGENGRDDDGDGTVDDRHGWDFAGVDNDPSPGLIGGEIARHGTHVAGIIGAVGNNGAGISGVSWRISIMPLRVFGDAGLTTTARIVDAIDYAGSHGARAFNASFGAETPSQAEHDAIAEYPRTLFVVAAPNEPVNLDAHPDYPCSYGLRNVVCVTATDRSGGLAAFAARGRRTADLAAPGVEIISTIPLGQYGTLSGTSQATPHVSGAIGLIASAHPKLGASRIKSILLMAAVRGKLKRQVAAGRLNARRALARASKVAAQAKRGRKDRKSRTKPSK